MEHEVILQEGTNNLDTQQISNFSKFIPMDSKRLMLKSSLCYQIGVNIFITIGLKTFSYDIPENKYLSSKNTLLHLAMTEKNLKKKIKMKRKSKHLFF